MKKTIFILSLLIPLVLFSDTNTSNPSRSVIGNTWTNSANVYTSNNLRASLILSDNPYGGAWDGFSFDIPSEATIEGIKVFVEGYNSSVNPETVLTIQVFDYNGGAFTEYSIETSGMAAFEGAYAYGAYNDLWQGTSWTPWEINSNFRVGLLGMTGAKDEIVWFVDHITVEIYYSIVSGLKINGVTEWVKINGVASSSAKKINGVAN